MGWTDVIPLLVILSVQAVKVLIVFPTKLQLILLPQILKRRKETKCEINTQEMRGPGRMSPGIHRPKQRPRRRSRQQWTGKRRAAATNTAPHLLLRLYCVDPLLQLLVERIPHQFQLFLHILRQYILPLPCRLMFPHLYPSTPHTVC
jgi:hypothetical protein